MVPGTTKSTDWSATVSQAIVTVHILFTPSVSHLHPQQKLPDLDLRQLLDRKTCYFSSISTWKLCYEEIKNLCVTVLSLKSCIKPIDRVQVCWKNQFPSSARTRQPLPAATLSWDMLQSYKGCICCYCKCSQCSLKAKELISEGWQTAWLPSSQLPMPVLTPACTVSRKTSAQFPLIRVLFHTRVLACICQFCPSSPHNSTLCHQKRRDWHYWTPQTGHSLPQSTKVHSSPLYLK